MKLDKIIFALGLLSILGSMAVQAGSSNHFKKGSNYVEHYGIINTVYLEESRLIIGDVNFYYNNETGIYNNSGARVSNLRNALKSGASVKFNFYQRPSGFILQTIRIVSSRELKNSKKISDVFY